jgi:hypothetical protein
VDPGTGERIFNEDYLREIGAGPAKPQELLAASDVASSVVKSFRFR